MSLTALYVTPLLTSFALALAALASLYGIRRAYLALSWVPAAFFLIVSELGRLAEFQPSAINWHEILVAASWTGLLQCALGAALAARAARRGQAYAGLLFATCVAAVPFLLRARV